MKKIGLNIAIFFLGVLLGAGGMYWTNGRAARTVNVTPSARVGFNGGVSGGPNLAPGAFGAGQNPAGAGRGTIAQGNLPPGYAPPGGARGQAQQGNFRPGAIVPVEVRVRGSIKKVTAAGTQRSAIFLVEQVLGSRTLGSQPYTMPTGKLPTTKPPLVPGQTLQIWISPLIKTKIKPGSYLAVLRTMGNGMTGGPPPIALQLENAPAAKKTAKKTD